MNEKQLTPEQIDFLVAFSNKHESDDAARIREKCFVAYTFKDYPKALSFLNVEFRRAMSIYAKAYKVFPEFFDETNAKYIDGYTHDFYRCVIQASSQLPKERAREYVASELTQNTALQMQHTTQARIDEIKEQERIGTRKPRAKKENTMDEIINLLRELSKRAKPFAVRDCVSQINAAPDEAQESADWLRDQLEIVDAALAARDG